MLLQYSCLTRKKGKDSSLFPDKNGIMEIENDDSLSRQLDNRQRIKESFMYVFTMIELVLKSHL